MIYEGLSSHFFSIYALVRNFIGVRKYPPPWKHTQEILLTWCNVSVTASHYRDPRFEFRLGQGGFCSSRPGKVGLRLKENSYADHVSLQIIPNVSYNIWAVEPREMNELNTPNNIEEPRKGID